VVEDHEARARGALVQRAHVIGHVASFPGVPAG
jgi:hypothetical protein